MNDDLWAASPTDCPLFKMKDEEKLTFQKAEEVNV